MVGMELRWFYPDVYAGPGGPSGKEFNGDMQPGWDTFYGTVAGRALSKNVCTVGNLERPDRLNPESSTGPVDIGRIKPDVVARGTQVFSPVGVKGGNSVYGYMSGTSMAAPVVSGIAALLGEQYQKMISAGINLPDSDPSAAGKQLYLRSDLMKALIIHGAVDLGRPGPDYLFGFGSVNAVNSLDALADTGCWRLGTFSKTLASENIDQFQEWTITVNEPTEIKITLVWNDPPPSTTGLIKKTLINNLNLSLIPEGERQVWAFTLDPDNPMAVATLPTTLANANNDDNVEQIVWHVEPGTHTVRISLDYLDFTGDDDQIYAVVCSQVLN